MTRTYQDLINQNPLMKTTFYELEKKEINFPLRRMRTWNMIKIPVLYDEPPDAQPRFRWVHSEWHHAEPTEGMKEWDNKYLSTLNRMQGMY